MAANAQYSTLTVVDKNNVEHRLPAQGLSFTFADGVLTAHSSEGAEVFAVNDLREMFFSDPASLEGVCGVVDGAVTLYDVNGVQAGCFESLEAALQKVAAGLYVVEGNGKTFKIAVK